MLKIVHQTLHRITHIPCIFVLYYVTKKLHVFGRVLVKGTNLSSSTMCARDSSVKNGRYKEFTLRIFVSLMLHEEGTQFVLFRLRPGRS